MGWPQWIFIALMLFGTVSKAAVYGRENHDNNSIPNYLGGLIATVSDNAIVVFVVYWGGFFYG